MFFSLLGAQDYRGGNTRVKWGQEMGQADMGGEFQEAHIVQVACMQRIVVASNMAWQSVLRSGHYISQLSCLISASRLAVL